MKTIGTTVISNTHFREVSKLLLEDDMQEKSSNHFYERSSDSWNQKNRLCDLLTFLDCLILNDKLYTLPATFESSNNVWDKLNKQGIIEILDTGLFSENIGKNILSKISEVNNFTMVAGSSADIGKTPIDKDLVFSEIKTFYSNKENNNYRGDLKFTDSYDFDIGGGTYDILRSDNFEDMARQLIGWLDYSGSGAYEACTSYLRDMYYIFSAEAIGVPYYPQSSRAEFAEKFPNYYDLNFKTKLYSKISNALNDTITNVYDDFEEKVAFIPPFASIILSRSNSRSEILNTALELRDEFAKTRKGFNELENERKETINLKERAKISKTQRQLLEDASKTFDKLNRINLQSTIKYIPEVIKPLTNPSDPTKYGSNLLLQPIELIVEWWRQRPIQKMYSIKDKVLQIDEYNSLLSKFYKIEKRSNFF